MSVSLRAASCNGQTGCGSPTAWSISLLAKDQRGGVAVLSAMAMASVIGMAGFAIDLGTAYAQKARLQKVADSAAMAGAISWVKSGSASSVRATIQAIVIANGWPASTILQPGQASMSASPKNSANHAIQVSLAASSTLTLARVISKLTSVTTTAYAAVEITATTQTACLVALNQLIIDGGVKVNLSGCSAEADSTASNAITINSGGSLTANTIATPGNIVANGTVNGVVKTGATAAKDPYNASQTQANHSGCTSYQNYANQSSIKAGCWTNVNVNSALTLSTSGAYYFQNININSGGSITGTVAGGVTMVLQSSASLSGNITLNAQTSGSFAGIAIYAAGGLTLNTGVNFNVNGAIYAPDGSMIFDAGTWNQASCTYVVAQSITFNGGSLTLPQTGCSTLNYPNTPQITSGTQIALVQ